MTTAKWQLYSQTGVDGPEYGVRISPGYVVVGFQKEDAKEIIGLRDEVEQLRSENKIISDRAAHHEKQDAAEIELLAARIRELEEANRNIDKRRDEMAAFIEWLEAAFLKSETERKFYTTINGMNSEFDWNGYPECPQNGIHKEWFRQQAREALEELRHG